MNQLIIKLNLPSRGAPVVIVQDELSLVYLYEVKKKKKTALRCF